MVVTIDDVAVLRRTVYARRVVPEAVLNQFGDERPPSERQRERRLVTRPGRTLPVGERRGPGSPGFGRSARNAGDSRRGRPNEKSGRGERHKGRKKRR